MNTSNPTCDEAFMQRALEVSIQARITAPPNPWVGCVLVHQGTIVGEGFTSPAGGPHAEINAIHQAGSKSKGATAYVTLEPCSHYGKTPPCVLALIKAKIARVVVAVLDPDSRVSGQGISFLRQAGIQVDLKIGEDAAKKFLAPYLHQRNTGLPYCVAKGAISVDGRIAAKNGSSQWISGEEARRHAHRLRAESQAIIVGSGTALSDLPRLTVRGAEIMPANPPLRVVLDSIGRVGINSPLFDLSLAPTLVVTTHKCPESTLRAWEKTGAEVALIGVGENGNGVDLRATLQLLGKRGILQVLIEGGGTVLGSFLSQHLLQRLCLYVGPCILGSKGLSLFNTGSIDSIDSAPKLMLNELTKLGNSFCADYLT